MRRLLVALACAGPMPLLAATHWLCGLSQDLTRIVCVADADLVASAAEADAPAAAVVNGTRFPLDPRRSYTVPMWGPATDLPSVELLARATMCYRSPGCEVTLAAPALQATAVTGARRR